MMKMYLRILDLRTAILSQKYKINYGVYCLNVWKILYYCSVN